MTDPHAEVHPRVWFVACDGTEVRAYWTATDGRDWLTVVDFRRPAGEMTTTRCVDE